MGALHAGHMALVEAAVASGAAVVTSIFVNPLQFGADEDLDAYPRVLESDLDLLRGEGVEIVFTPSASAMRCGLKCCAVSARNRSTLSGGHAAVNRDAGRAWRAMLRRGASPWNGRVCHGCNGHRRGPDQA